jgi:hypothetical protein
VWGDDDAVDVEAEGDDEDDVDVADDDAIAAMAQTL